MAFKAPNTLRQRSIELAYKMETMVGARDWPLKGTTTVRVKTTIYTRVWSGTLNGQTVQ